MPLAPARPAPAASFRTVRRPILLRFVRGFSIVCLSLDWFGTAPASRKKRWSNESLSPEPRASNRREGTRGAISLSRFGLALAQCLEHFPLEVSDGLLVPRTERSRYIRARRVIAPRR